MPIRKQCSTLPILRPFPILDGSHFQISNTGTANISRLAWCGLEKRERGVRAGMGGILINGAPLSPSYRHPCDPSPLLQPVNEALPMRRLTAPPDR